jgi:hypothetical protein
VRWRALSLRRAVVVLYAAAGTALLPWALYLLGSLKPHHETGRWDLAWSGFDTGLSLACLLTALAAYRRSWWVGPLAAATGTLLVADAWFDIVLESHDEELTAVLMAVFAELPLAAVCLWLAFRAERVCGARAGAAERRLHLPPSRQRSPERDFVGVLEVAADRKPAREPRHPDATA